MPTYTITTIPGQFFVELATGTRDEFEIIDSGSAIFSVTSTEEFATQYFFDDDFTGGLPSVDFDDQIGESLFITINGQQLDTDFTSAGTVFWGNNNETQVLLFETGEPGTGLFTSYALLLGGDPVADIVDVVETTTGFGPINSGPFAPLTTFSLSDIPGAVQTQTDTFLGNGQANELSGTDIDDAINGLGGDDTLRGEDGDDLLEGRAGADTLRGGSGNDLLEGGSGGDALLGGSGADIATYVSSTSGVSVNLATGAASGGHANGDTLVSIEGLLGSRFADALTGSDGNNVIYGGRGGDTLRGGLGNDVIEGGGGGDRVLGGSGIDTASYLSATNAVSLNLTTGVGTQGNANGDTFASIENVLGSDFDDMIIGSGANNGLSGGSGDDELRGSAGNDVLEGGAGGDFLNGGSGIDTASYASATAGVALDLAGSGTAGDADGDTFFRVENVIGSGFDDAIRGDDGDNAISGGRGDDVIRGGRGGDTITGGRGDDTMFGGGGDDTFVFRNNNGADTITAFNTDADAIRFAINGIDETDLAFAEDTQGLIINYGTGTITLDGLTEAAIEDIAFIFG